MGMNEYDTLYVQKSLRISQDQEEAVKFVVRKLPLIYDSESHFFRVAVLRELRRAKKALKTQKENSA